MGKQSYPLAQVLQVKQKRVEDAEVVVKECIRALEKEQEILEQKKAERDKVKQHYQDKLSQLRALMDEGTTSPKIQSTKAYLKIVQEKIVIEEKKVADQQKVVEAAEKKLEEARADLKRKQQEVDKFMEHRKSWTKEMLKEEQIIEGREQDDLGETVFLSRRHKNKQLEK